MKIFLSIFCLCLFFGCSSETEIAEIIEQNKPQLVEKSVYKSFKNDIGQYAEVFSIDTRKEHVLKTKNGTRIHIGKNSFVDENGSPVAGKILFTVNEYNTRGEIIASNIPMTYTNPQGDKVQFESAGMFSLMASSNSQPLVMAKDKKIKVEYATKVTGSFNFYKLESDSSNWEVRETDCLPLKNKYLESAQKKLLQEQLSQPANPKKPLIANEDDLLFDIKSSAHHGSSFTREFNGLMWKFVGDSASMNPATAGLRFNDVHELRGMEPLDTNFLAFELKFENVQSKAHITLEAAPVYRGAMLDRQEQKYQETIARIEASIKLQNALLKEIENEKTLLRTFNVDALGVYNYDIQFKDINSVPFVANFTFEGEIQPQVNVYLLPTAKRVVVKYTPETFNNFAINPKSTNKIIAILPNKDVYFLSHRAIEKMYLSSKTRGSTVTFDLKKINKAIKNPADLDAIIDHVV